MKKQTFFNVIVFFWLCSLSGGMLFLSVSVFKTEYKETMQKLGISTDIDKALSKVMDESAVSPELKKMVSDLLGSSSQAGVAPRSSPRRQHE